MSNKEAMNRRNFLRNSAIGVGALGISGVIGDSNLLSAQSAKQEPPAVQPLPMKIKEYRTLGRTGFKVSDISCGFANNPAVLERLLDMGVNYIDTAEAYGNEDVVGNVVKKRDRKSIFITTKISLKENPTKEQLIYRTNKCLERLQTNYVDCMMIHAASNVASVKDEAFHAAMKQLKSEGKVRFLGISNHGSNWYTDPEETMDKVLIAAALDGRFDVMLLAYNFIQEDNGAQVLKICKEKNIGTTLMKVNPIGKVVGLKERLEKAKKDSKKEDIDALTGMIAKMESKAKLAEEFIKKYKLDDYDKMRNAAIRFVLSNPDVHTVCCAHRSFDDLDLYVPLSGSRLDGMDNAKLNAYKAGCSEFYCRHACGKCESSCPEKVPVNSIMRFRHYFETQGYEKYAMKNYAELKSSNAAIADRCVKCSGHCEKACPYGVPVQSLLHLAHNTLTLA